MTRKTIAEMTEEELDAYCDGLWVSGPALRAPAPMEQYVHLIRSPSDPERLSREARKKLGASPTSWCSDLKKSAAPEWKARMLALVQDDKERTFNALVLELSGYQYTADVAHGKAPDVALWELVAENAIEHTIKAPILFRAKRQPPNQG